MTRRNEVTQIERNTNRDNRSFGMDDGRDMEQDELEPFGFVRTSSCPVHVRGKIIGHSHSSVVYQCHDVSSGDVYAYKAPKSPRRSQLSPQEFGAAARVSLLKHENVVHGCPSPREGVTMEYIDGQNLKDMLDKRKSPFTEAMTAGFLQQILQGLKYLHSKDVVHGDIKCSNIMMESSTGTCKVSDIARVADEEARHVGGVVLPAGTPVFMAPEVVRTGKHSKESDVWSVGCTVLEMLSGELPWNKEDSRFSAMFKIAQGRHPPIPDGISEAAKSFLEACFRPAAADRPNANEIIAHAFLRLGRKRRDPSVQLPSSKAENENHARQSTSSMRRSSSYKILKAPIQIFFSSEASSEHGWNSCQMRRCSCDPNVRVIKNWRAVSPVSSPRAAPSPLARSQKGKIKLMSSLGGSVSSQIPPPGTRSNAVPTEFSLPCSASDLMNSEYSKPGPLESPTGLSAGAQN